jgi:hypothetical protein
LLNTVRKNLQNIIDQPVGRNYYSSKNSGRQMLFSMRFNRERQAKLQHAATTSCWRACRDALAKETLCPVTRSKA